MAGDPTKNGNKKALFLITHSPFIIDLQSLDDMRSVLSFDLEYAIPKQVYKLNISCSESFVRRLSAHHKQLFFSDNPVFVEGILDAWIVQGMMEALGTSLSAAGSCVIDVNGVEEVNQYLSLSQGLGKNAHFLYDLDGLCRGTLRRRINEDASIRDFLVTEGLGDSIIEYFGELQQRVTSLVDKLLSGSLPSELTALKDFLHKLGPRSQWQTEQHDRARVAVITSISKYREDVIAQSSQSQVADIEARLSKVLTALEKKNIHVLPGGTLERYLPLFIGSVFGPTPVQKRDAVLAELEAMTGITKEEDLASRYTDLYKAVRKLPSREPVNVDLVLRTHLATYIHGLQQTVVDHPDWDQEMVPGPFE